MNEDKNNLTSHWRVKIDKINRNTNSRPPQSTGFNFFEMQMRWKIDKRKRNLIANPLPHSSSSSSNHASIEKQSPSPPPIFPKSSTKRSKLSSSSSSSPPSSSFSSPSCDPPSVKEKKKNAPVTLEPIPSVVTSSSSSPSFFNSTQKYTEEEGYSSLSSPACSSPSFPPIFSETKLEASSMNSNQGNLRMFSSQLPPFLGSGPESNTSSSQESFRFQESSSPYETPLKEEFLARRSLDSTSNQPLPPILLQSPINNSNTNVGNRLEETDKEMDHLVSKFFIYPQTNANTSSKLPLISNSH